jgi:hypothetical protein
VAPRLGSRRFSPDAARSRRTGRLTTQYYFDANSTGEKRAPCLAPQRTRTHQTSGSFMQIANPTMSGPAVDESVESRSPNAWQCSGYSPHVATAAEVLKNYRENPAAVWYKDGADQNDHAGKYAFQRLRQTWFTPHVTPKFKLRRDDKFYAIGSCFARGLETAFKRTASQLKARRRNSPNFSRPRKVHQDSDLRISITAIQP